MASPLALLAAATFGTSDFLAGLSSRRLPVVTVTAGILAAIANLLFLTATGHGELAIVAVLISLYPGCTVILARVVLAERWSRSQAIGLLAALLAVVLVSVDSA
jgi:uncharacterized membrane protein